MKSYYTEGYHATQHRHSGAIGSGGHFKGAVSDPEWPVWKSDRENGQPAHGCLAAESKANLKGSKNSKKTGSPKNMRSAHRTQVRRARRPCWYAEHLEKFFEALRYVRWKLTLTSNCTRSGQLPFLAAGFVLAFILCILLEKID